MADQSTGIYGHWGTYAEAAQLPNVAGATLQTHILRIGDLAVAEEVVYQCTTAVEEGAIWAALAGGGPAPVSPVLWKWNETDTSQFNVGGAIDVGSAPDTLTVTRLPADDGGPTRLRLNAQWDPTISDGVGVIIPVNDLPTLPRRFVVRCEYVQNVCDEGQSFGLVGPWTDDAAAVGGNFYGCQGVSSGSNRQRAFVELSASAFTAQNLTDGPISSSNEPSEMIQVVYNSHTHTDGTTTLGIGGYVDEIDINGGVKGGHVALINPVNDANAALNQFGIGVYVQNTGEGDDSDSNFTLAALEILKHPMDL